MADQPRPHLPDGYEHPAGEPPRPLPPPTLGGLLAELADSWRERLLPDPDRARLVRTVAVVLLAAGAAVAGWSLLRPPALPPTEELIPYTDGAAGSPRASVPEGAAPSTTVPATLVVHAAGAVVSPGLHRLEPGSRVADLLDAAGGPSPQADLDRVNLAAPVTDGQRVWFPTLGEADEPAVVAGTGGGGAPGPSAGGTVPLVDLNAATVEELDVLPGIGPATASAIVEHRGDHGPFRSVDDLLEVPGIGEAKLTQLRDLVTV